jgi:outer membrane protein TolC
MEESAINEVRNAIRAITASYKQIEVTDRSKSFAEERFRAFTKKAEVGLATIKDLLEVESDLLKAKNSQIQALVEYNNSITKLWTVTGEIIQQTGIRVREDDADQLYKNVK